MSKTTQSAALVIGALISLSSQAQTSGETINVVITDKKENHEHKHLLPTEAPIPFRLESVPSQAHPDEAKRLREQSQTLPQK